MGPQLECGRPVAPLVNAKPNAALQPRLHFPTKIEGKKSYNEAHQLSTLRRLLRLECSTPLQLWLPFQSSRRCAAMMIRRLNAQSEACLERSPTLFASIATPNVPRHQGVKG